MDLSISSLGLAFGAGLASILSPCVLPVVPIIVTGSDRDHALRPLLIVAGLAAMFIAMGVVSSLFGAVIAGKMRAIEVFTGVLVATMGILLLLDVNLFKRLPLVHRVHARATGPLGGAVLGLSLGLVWIPCVGPMLSSVLAVVATRGQVSSGVVLLSVYSLGFAVPMLVAGYAARRFRQSFGRMARHPVWLRGLSGGLLLVFGAVISVRGLAGFGW